MSKRFVRPDTHRLSKIGKGRPKLQTWRRPRGKHNKTRLKRFGYPIQPEIGFGTPRKLVGKVDGLTPKLVTNMADLLKLTKSDLVIVARRIGAKKKMEILKKAESMNLKIANLRSKK